MQQSQKRKPTSQGGNAPKRQMLVATSEARALTPVSAPVASSDRVKPYFEVSKRSGLAKDAISTRGCDYLGPVFAANQSTEVAGTPLVNFDFGPIELGRSRLGLFAMLYERWRARKLKFHFIPSVPTSQKGSLMLAFDRDVSDPTPPASPDGLRQYMAMEGAGTAPVWAPQSITIVPNQRDLLFTNSVAGLGPGAVNYDPRLNYAGTFYVVVVGPTGLATGTAMGDAYVEYEIDFEDACLDNQYPTFSAIQTLDLPTAHNSDFLYGFRTGSANLTVTNPSNSALLPFVPPGASAAVIGLSEGIWRATATIQQNAAGTVAFTPPSVVANVPLPAPAAAPAVRALLNTPSAVSGDYASADYLIGVPPGGGQMTFPMSLFSGIAAAGAPANLYIEKLRTSVSNNFLSTIF